MQVADTITVGEETKAVIKFKNTTAMKLHRGVFHVEGAGLLPPETIHEK
jgi:hypothetical protein